MSQDIKTRPLSGAERQRRHRRRKGRGLRCIRILISLREINALVEKGYVDPSEGKDADAIAFGVSSLMSEALDF